MRSDRLLRWGMLPCISRRPAGGCVALCASLLLCGAFAVTPALALNSERHYELVSPVFKGGYGATIVQGVSSDGNGVAYFSQGAFAGAPSGGGFLDYLARRAASGWSTVPLMPPATSLSTWLFRDVSPSLDLAFAAGYPGLSAEDVLPGGDLLIHPTDLPDTVANWALVGALEGTGKGLLDISYIDADVGFCHVLLANTGEALLPEAIGAKEPLAYDFDRGCSGGTPSLRLVALNNKSKPINLGCAVDIGIAKYTHGVSNTYNAVSADGSEVFFTDCLSGGAGPASPHQLFVRLGGARTVEVSRPLGACVAKGIAGEVPCDGASERASADFAGAAADGSRVFFTTAAALSGEDKDTGNDLYVASIGCPEAGSECEPTERVVTSLVQVSHDPNAGEAAGVQDVVRVAPDGSRVYFQAGGDLLSAGQRQALESEGRPVPQPGGPNLYVYDTASPGSVAFIGTGVVGASENGAEAQTAGADGRFLVFSTSARLVAGDTDSAKDVYRYDAQTGALARVSLGEGGYGANGNAETAGAGIAAGHFGGTLRDQYEMDNRAVSEDGSRIVFTSAERLSPEAHNKLVNAYEWHEQPGESEGQVSLVSSGSAEDPVTDVVISQDGANVFFVTTQGLVPQDGDGSADIYDARLGEAFPPAPAEPRRCESDACQGPLTNPAPLLVPGSAAQAPGGNFAPPVAAATLPPRKPAVKCKKGRKLSHGKCVKVKKRKSLGRRARRLRGEGR